jgi:tripartite-type tricarboxylate transporter receptor subunit TctC
MSNMKFTQLVTALILTTLISSGTYAQTDWPNKTITIVVPYAPGGFSDTRFRLLARKLSEKLGQSVIIDNKAGAGGVLGTALVAKSAPDGYTIGVGSFAPLAINPELMKKVPYDVATDLIPVILIENSPLILSVAKNLPVKNLAELIALAKKEPNKLTYGSSGLGGAHHLSGEMLRSAAQIDIIHVPYKGGSPAATDLMAGHLSMMFELGYAALPSIKAGAVRPIAVTSAKRLAALPDVPTMAEAGLPDYISYNWQGVILPAKTPPAIVAKMNKVFNELLKDPDVAKAITDVASQSEGGTPEAFGKFIQSERVKWAAIIKAANIAKE